MVLMMIMFEMVFVFDIRGVWSIVGILEMILKFKIMVKRSR